MLPLSSHQQGKLQLVDNEDQLPPIDINQAPKDTNSPPMDLTRDLTPGCDVLKRYVSVVIKDTLVYAFVNTGTDISVISEDFKMTTMSLCKQPIVKQFVPLTGVTGDPLDSVG